MGPPCSCELVGREEGAGWGLNHTLVVVQDEVYEMDFPKEEEIKKEVQAVLR